MKILIVIVRELCHAYSLILEVFEIRVKIVMRQQLVVDVLPGFLV
jgi:hypothetical protein